MKVSAQEEYGLRCMLQLARRERAGKAQPLTLSEIERIIDLQVKLLRVRLIERHLELELTKAAKEYIAREGYDPVYGARPLKRYLQRHLETALSRQILAGTIPENSRVTVDFKKGQLTFESVPIRKEEGE